MNSEELIRVFSSYLPAELAADLVENFNILKRDASLKNLGNSAPGKFVETLVQVLQHLETGKYETAPKVDDYLKNLESRKPGFDDDLKVCTSRIGRAMYTLRNKRNIAHKNTVDPNSYDLRFLYGAAQWVLSELVRRASGISMEEAGILVSEIQEPLSGVVQRFGDLKTVLHDLTTAEEVILILNDEYPSRIGFDVLRKSLARRNETTVRKALKSLWESKKIECVGTKEYALTHKGIAEAVRIFKKIAAEALSSGC